MKTFTTHLQTMILMVLFAFATVQKANASAKAGEASVYEGSTVTIALADTYKRTLMQSTGVTYQWYSENNSYATVTSSTRYNATVKGIKATSSCKVYFKTYVNGRYKLSVDMNSNEGELFDLENDPNEMENLWDNPNYKDIKRELLLEFIQKSMKTEPVVMPRIAVA